MPQASTLRDEHDQRDVAFAEDEAEYRHEQGEDVDYFPGKRQTPQVVFEGAGILVVYKPPHWTMTTTAEMPRDKSMQAWLGDTIGRRCKYLREDPLQSGLVQRLDVETSGPVVVATERGTFNKMWQLRAAGHFYREYRVLMHGLLPLKRCAGTLNYSLDTGRKFTKVWACATRRAWRTSVGDCPLPAIAGGQPLSFPSLSGVSLRTTAGEPSSSTSGPWI